MKYNVLAIAVVAGSLLSACDTGGSDAATSYTAQAYDPAVQNMDVTYQCNEDAIASSGQTDFDGNAVFSNATVIATPENCEFTFTGNEDSIDTSNGKSMDGVIYRIPKGLAQAGKKVTASPLTTAIHTALDGEEYNEQTASDVIGSLGLTDIINDGVSIEDLLLDTESVANAASAEDKATILATTAVLSDVIKNNPDATADEITEATAKVAAAVIEANPNYPTTAESSVIYVELSEDLSDVATINSDDTVIDATAIVEEGEAEVNPDAATGTGTGTGSTSGGN